MKKEEGRRQAHFERMQEYQLRNDEKTKRFQDFRARAGIDELAKADEAQYLKAAEKYN